MNEESSQGGWRRQLRVRPGVLALVAAVGAPVLAWHMGYFQSWRRGNPGWVSPEVGDDSLFNRLGRPQPGDWLYQFDEPGQTVARFKSVDRPRPDARRSHLVLQPIGPFSDQQRELLGQMRDFCEAFFAMPTRSASTSCGCPCNSTSSPGTRSWRTAVPGSAGRMMANGLGDASSHSAGLELVIGYWLLVICYLLFGMETIGEPLQCSGGRSCEASYVPGRL